MRLEVLDQYVSSEKMTLNYERYIEVNTAYFKSFLKYCQKHKISQEKLLSALRRNFKRYSKLPAHYKEKTIEAFYIDFSLSFLKKDRTKTLLVNNVLKSFLYAHYTLAKSLQAIMGKEQGLNVFKAFVDAQIKKTGLPQVENVRDFLFMNMKEIHPLFKNSFNRVEFELDEGRAGCKIKKCRWHQVMKKLADPETAYAIACHFDFIAAKCSNKNFRLTREKTIMEGGIFCDFIWHDLRVVKKVVHPDEKFWEKV